MFEDDEEIEVDVEGDDAALGFGGVIARGVTQVVRQRIGLWRQILGVYAYGRGAAELAAITPVSSRPAEFPGIRAYYPIASSLSGLQVKSNWQVTPVRVDTSDASASFVVANVTNPHPGAWVMMFGPEQSEYSQSAHYENPSPKEWPRKTERRSGKPRMMTTWQTLAGLAFTFHPSPFLHPAVHIREGFAEQVYAVAQKWGTLAAAQALEQATGAQYVPAKTTFWMRIGGKAERVTVGQFD